MINKALPAGTVRSVYLDIFSEDTDKLLAVGKDLKLITELRADLEKEEINCESET